MKFQIRNVRKFIAKFCRHNIKKLEWAKHLRTRKHIENEKGVEEVEKKQCWKCRCWRVLELYSEKMLHAMFDWGKGKTGRRRMRRKLGS